MSRLATCVWRVTPQLIVALDEKFGEPIDAYVNGSQVWHREDGPKNEVIEWRLHPAAAFERPAEFGTYDLFSSVALLAASGSDRTSQLVGLWDCLEAYPAFTDEVEPAPLRAVVASTLEIEPDLAGLVDHQIIGDQWERMGGAVSILASLEAQLTS